MPITNSPHGLASFGLPILPEQGSVNRTGNVFWVDSNADGNGDGSFDSPFTTIDYAVGMCTASNGDIIYVKEGHAETVSSSTSLVFDVVGVTVIGCGSGALRPYIQITATGAYVPISANSVTLKNMWVKVTVDEVVKAFYVTAHAVTLDGIDFWEPDTSYQLQQFLLTNASANWLTIKNCHHGQTTAAGANVAWISLVGADDCRILNNMFFVNCTNNSSSMVIGGATTESLKVFIIGNFINCGDGAAALGIAMQTNSTGIIAYNVVMGAFTAITQGVNAASCYCAENYSANTANASGIIEPAVDS